LNATASSNLAVSYRIVSGPASIANNILTITGAGVVTVEASQAGDSNYAAATPVVQSFTVTRAHLTVSADNQTRLYGQGNPAFTAPVTGFVTGETLSSSGVSGAADIGSSASAASPVGAYGITAAAGTLAATNYDFTFVPGSLAVKQAGTTVALKTSASPA